MSDDGDWNDDHDDGNWNTVAGEEQDGGPAAGDDDSTGTASSHDAEAPDTDAETEGSDDGGVASRLPLGGPVAIAGMGVGVLSMFLVLSGRHSDVAPITFLGAAWLKPYLHVTLFGGFATAYVFGDGRGWTWPVFGLLGLVGATLLLVTTPAVYATVGSLAPAGQDALRQAGFGVGIVGVGVPFALAKVDATFHTPDDPDAPAPAQDPALRAAGKRVLLGLGIWAFLAVNAWLAFQQLTAGEGFEYFPLVPVRIPLLVGLVVFLALLLAPAGIIGSAFGKMRDSPYVDDRFMLDHV